MKATGLKVTKPDTEIITFFENLPKRVLKTSDIKSILSENKRRWRLATSTTGRTFIDFLLARTSLQEVVLKFPNRDVVRYTWGPVSAYELVSSLEPNSYFTHFTAMYLHELTDQIPKTIYLNREQRPKAKSQTELEQTRIDAAFARPVRASKNVAQYGDQKICLLNGKHTGKLGVIDIKGPDGNAIQITNLERTLIDIAVRPAYSGAVYEVLKAYRSAQGKVSVNKLAAYLQEIDYIYPYHQAIGFYLDRAGVYKHSQLELLRGLGMDFDFYLTHQMGSVDYCKEWRLYIPKGF